MLSPAGCDFKTCNDAVLVPKGQYLMHHLKSHPASSLERHSKDIMLEAETSDCK